MKSLVDANRIAIQFLAFFVTPIGLLIMLVLVQIVEGGGIAIFFSELALEKSKAYIDAVNKINPHINARQILQFASFGAGVFLSLTAVTAILSLRLMSRDFIANIFSILFAILSFSTYYNVVDADFSMAIFNDMSKFWRIVGILTIVVMSSTLASAISTKLAKYVKDSNVFKELLEAINTRLSESWDSDGDVYTSVSSPATSSFSSRMNNL